MAGELPKAVLDGLHAAQRADKVRKNRMRLRAGDKEYPIRRLWDAGLALDAKDAPHIRGLVDIYDGSRHVSTALVICCAEEGHERVYEFKWHHPVSDTAPVDYDKGDGPVALLT